MHVEGRGGVGAEVLELLHVGGRDYAGLWWGEGVVFVDYESTNSGRELMSIGMAAWCREVGGGNKVITQVVFWELEECGDCVIWDEEGWVAE